MTSKNNLVFINNGWLFLQNRAKYNNNPMIKVESIDYFNYYSEIKETLEPNYVVFHIGTKETKWYFSEKEDAKAVYIDLVELLIDRKEI